MTMEFMQDKLKVSVAENRQELGKLAAEAVKNKIKELLQKQKSVRMIFAAAPSQDEVLYELTTSNGIDWKRIVAFHMDEYINLPEGSPQLFQSYLNEHLFSKVPFRKVNLIDFTAADHSGECKRYGDLIKENPIDIICMGIGENGHVAFNDPGVADFHDRQVMKVVELDEACRKQQVNDGCFPDLKSVPKRAYTLTVPTLFAGSHLIVSVPGIRKAEAVRITLKGAISEKCPASILRNHDDATLFIDKDSSSLLGK